MPTNHTTTAHCAKKIVRQGEWSQSFCRRPPTVTEPDGTVWCKQHAPSAIRAERQRQMAERDRREGASARAKSNAEEGIDALVIVLSRAGVPREAIDQLINHGARADFRSARDGGYSGFTGGIVIDGSTLRAITLAIQSEVRS